MGQTQEFEKPEVCCHDCDVLEGNIHELGCDEEICPFCHRQLFICACIYEQLHIEHEHRSDDLSDAQVTAWLGILEKKGRIPFIEYPTVCAKCGKLWPDSFMVSDEAWEHYIDPWHRKARLCLECYQYIKQVTDQRSGKRPIDSPIRILKPRPKPA